ncbi:MAG: tripartite tricarboxylate transporter substrate binding protein, partial [Desulfobulbia bacterium]
KELGKDFVYFMQRTVVGAPDMNPEAVAYYQDLFKRVFNSPEWTSYRTKRSLLGDMLTGQSLMDYWKKEREIHRQMLVKMGAIKQ